MKGWDKIVILSPRKDTGNIRRLLEKNVMGYSEIRISYDKGNPDRFLQKVVGNPFEEEK